MLTMVYNVRNLLSQSQLICSLFFLIKQAHVILSEIVSKVFAKANSKR